MEEVHPLGVPPSTALDEGEFRAVLDAMFDHVAIGESVRDESGEIVDFRMVYLNAASLDGAGRGATELVGRTILECFPGWAEQGQLARFIEVIETGEPYVADRLAYADVTADGTVIVGHWSMSVVRFGDGYIAASRNVTDLVADEQAKLAAQREDERSQMAVELLQRAALPDVLPEIAGVELAARYEPVSNAQPVGGDWYDAFVLESGLLGLVIADVTGHGLDAAAYMVQVRNVVRALAFEHTEPGRVLEQVNRVLVHIGEPNLFATCCYAVLDPPTGALAWASAGHYAPLRIAATSAYLPTTVGPPLGVVADARFPESNTTIERGDLLVLFTDGLVEDRSRALKVSLDALVEASAACVGRSTADAADVLVSSAADRSDDLALICVRRQPV